MAGEPDVRLEGVTHEQIVEWAAQGKAGKSTNVLEARMKQVVEALHEAANKVNGAVQQTASGWEGMAAETATADMIFLRDFDDELLAHGGKDRESAMGQSGESAATRDRVPPIPLNLDGPQTILATTVDPKVRIDAQREAAARAREVLAEYQEATRHRLASLPLIAPVPTVVLDTGGDNPTAPAGANAQTRRPAAPAPVPGRAGGATGGSVVATPVEPGPVKADPVEAGPVPPVHEAPATTPQSTGAPVAGSVPARGDPVAAVDERPVVGGQPEVVETKGGSGGVRGGAGPKSGAERVVERQPVVHRDVGGGRTGGPAASGMLGGAGAPGDKHDEHHNRYHVPSGEPFEDDDDEMDGEFYVAPDVIGGPE